MKQCTETRAVKPPKQKLAAGGKPRGVPRPSAGLAARGLAALQVVEVHVHLPRNLDRHLRVAAAEAAADGVGDDAEALPEPDGGEGE